MNSKVQIIQTSQFVQLVAVPLAQSTNSSFDIIIETEISIQSYCEALADKVFSLHQSQFPDFINYQCNNVENAIIWLNKFEKLITLNEKLFTRKCAFTGVSKLINLIEKKRSEMQSSRIVEVKYETPKRFINAESEDRIFSFYETKKHIETLEDFDDKIFYLTEELLEYEEADIVSTHRTLKEFNVQCEKLINKLERLKCLNEKRLITKQNFNNNHISLNKIQINCNVNQLVDVFYRLNREFFVDGKPFIDGNTNDIVNAIVNIFVDKDGRNLSPLTVATIMKPSKEEKRPNIHKRIDIEKFL
ncbi:hypothetical protein [Flavobacterium sp.]|uniref:hypothetical protein n=1 Tax=Flavobacterium sp. TaxID=239 RepID=UPI00286D30B1|nr:hypothetical protein [Flavobacterium sp.]